MTTKKVVETIRRKKNKATSCVCLCVCVSKFRLGFFFVSLFFLRLVIHVAPKTTTHRRGGNGGATIYSAKDILPFYILFLSSSSFLVCVIVWFPRDTHDGTKSAAALLISTLSTFAFDSPFFSFIGIQ